MQKELIWNILLAVAAILLVLNAITQPKKSLEVAVLWTPPFPDFLKEEPEYKPHIHNKEQIVYRVYYAWNGKRDRLPWWIISKTCIDGRWRIIEACNSDNYNTESPEDNVLFDENWSVRRDTIARTRFENIRCFLLNTDNLSREKRAIKKVVKLIEMQERLEAENKGLFDSFKAYINQNPKTATFFPDDKKYWDGIYMEIKEDFQQNTKHSKDL